MAAKKGSRMSRMSTATLSPSLYAQTMHFYLDFMDDRIQFFFEQKFGFMEDTGELCFRFLFPSFPRSFENCRHLGAVRRLGLSAFATFHLRLSVPVHRCQAETWNPRRSCRWQVESRVWRMLAPTGLWVCRPRGQVEGLGQHCRCLDH